MNNIKKHNHVTLPYNRCIGWSNMRKLSTFTGNGCECSHSICWSMSKAPCLVCGQTDHPFVEWQEMKVNTWNIFIRCPISMYDTWEEVLESIDDRSRYTFKAEKLLSKYGYCEEEVLEAFRIYETSGYGKILKIHSPALHRASRLALMILCQNARHLHIFKREIRPTIILDDGQNIELDSNHSG